MHLPACPTGMRSVCWTAGGSSLVGLSYRCAAALSCSAWCAQCTTTWALKHIGSIHKLRLASLELSAPGSRQHGLLARLSSGAPVTLGQDPTPHSIALCLELSAMQARRTGGAALAALCKRCCGMSARRVACCPWRLAGKAAGLLRLLRLVQQRQPLTARRASPPRSAMQVPGSQLEEARCFKIGLLLIITTDCVHLSCTSSDTSSQLSSPLKLSAR